MTHDEIVAGINKYIDAYEKYGDRFELLYALRNVVELHKPFEDTFCEECIGYISGYPCPTIQAIEKELK